MWPRSNLHSRPEISGDPYYLQFAEPAGSGISGCKNVVGSGLAGEFSGIAHPVVLVKAHRPSIPPRLDPESVS
jgi:hypothetical protein